MILNTLQFIILQFSSLSDIALSLILVMNFKEKNQVTRRLFLDDCLIVEALIIMNFLTYIRY